MADIRLLALFQAVLKQPSRRHQAADLSGQAASPLLPYHRRFNPDAAVETSYSGY
jgi:hypothetical protein